MIEKMNLKKLKRSELEDQFQTLIHSDNEGKDRLLSEKKINILFEKIVFDDKKNEIIEEYFDDLSIKETSTIRLVFLKNDYFLQKICFSRGQFEKDYGLLDDQIIDQVGVKNNLLVQDTSRIHNVRFFQGHNYPRSLAAFPILEKNSKIGIVWIGDTNYQAFAKNDLEQFEKIVFIYRSPLAALIKNEILEQERQTLQQIILQDDRPIIIINSNQEISFANYSAVKAFDLIQSDNDQFMTSQVDFSAIFNQYDLLEMPTFLSDDRVYELKEIETLNTRKFQAALCVFKDKTADLAKNKYLSTIVSTLTQKLRSPLVEIQGLVSLVNALGNLSTKQSEFVTQIKNNIDEIEESVEQLLSLNRIQNDGFLQIDQFSMYDCVNNVTAMLSPFAKQKQIEINSHLDHAGEIIISDKTLIKHALLNILDYAIKETHMGGSIDINQQINTQHHSVSITDSGKGISKVDVKKILEGKTANILREELEITKDIMSILKGHLMIESDLGAGTTITLQFPKIV